MKELIEKYNIPGPRYTSYPTVPHWSNIPNQEAWKKHVQSSFKTVKGAKGISIYVHLPYCESLCTYCGCNMQVSKNHSVELPYIDTLIAEWEMYSAIFPEKPVIQEIHLGGGTPTFFSPENLAQLIQALLKNSTVAENHEFSFEAHPKNTTVEHLQTLYDLGFRRLSLGVQDFDPVVQEVINRIQPLEMVEEVVNNARKIGYDSVNFDLIYGLPLQTEKSVIGTIEKVKTLKPDRIAFYSYAHVPWDKKMQRKFTEADLPEAEQKRNLYEIGKKLFFEAGYLEVGMDHFALPKDPLFIAIEAGTLHRNFMGYTSNSTRLLVGLGVSSISDSWTCFAQNSKSISEYKKMVSEGVFPIVKGHQLTPQEEDIRQHVLNLMCNFYTSWEGEGFMDSAVNFNKSKLNDMQSEGLLNLTSNSIQVTELGQIFVRNICMLIDPKLQENGVKDQQFSKTI